MKLLVFNQYYPPDTAATAPLLADLCQDLALKHQVTVICGRPSYDPLPEEKSSSGRHVSNNLRVLRVPSTSFHRSRMAGRLSNYLTYVACAFIFGLFHRRSELVVAMTDPPFVGLIGWLIAFIKRLPFVYIIQDLYPDVAVSLGKIKNPLIIRVFDLLNLFLFSQADRLVTISSSMRERIMGKGIGEEKVLVIPNWADTEVVTPQLKENSFSLRYGLNNRFVVMYSGNVGFSQNLDVLIEAAATLQGLSDLVIVIIGEGAGKSKLLDKARKLKLENILFFPYQPIEQMCYSFATADVFVIPLMAGLDGLVVPSKVFSIMASGRPFIAAIDRTSEVARIAEEFGCGLVVEPDNPEKLTEAIRWSYDRRTELTCMGEKGRKAVEVFYSKATAISNYERLFLAAGVHA